MFIIQAISIAKLKIWRKITTLDGQNMSDLLENIHFLSISDKFLHFSYIFSPPNLHISKLFRTFAPDFENTLTLHISTHQPIK